MNFNILIDILFDLLLMYINIFNNYGTKNMVIIW